MEQSYYEIIRKLLELPDLTIKEVILQFSLVHLLLTDQPLTNYYNEQVIRHLKAAKQTLLNAKYNVVEKRVAVLELHMPAKQFNKEMLDIIPAIIDNGLDELLKHDKVMHISMAFFDVIYYLQHGIDTSLSCVYNKADECIHVGINPQE